jgi:hypothetical protein
MMKNKRWNKDEAKKHFHGTTNELIGIALKFNSTKVIDPECAHYCDIYAQYFSPMRNEELKILEIGVKEGDSLLMWKEYFPNSLIFGLEHNPDPLRNFEHERIQVFIGDQSDVPTLQKIVEEQGPFDIIIDDASHIMEHHQISFNYLFPNGLADKGIYIIEDLGTSYWKKWGGGLERSTSTIEFLKKLIDGTNYRFHKGARTQYVGIPDHNITNATYFDKNIKGLCFYKGMCVIEKGSNYAG